MRKIPTPLLHHSEHHKKKPGYSRLPMEYYFIISVKIRVRFHQILSTIGKYRLEQVKSNAQATCDVLAETLRAAKL